MRAMPVDVSKLTPYRSAVDDNSYWSDFEPRPGDIFVCTPAKCGTTWTQTIVASLLWPNGPAPGPVMQLSPWIEFKALPHEVVRATLEAQTHRRFMKSHTPADGIPFFPDAKYLVVGRDGRDAFMSLCNHMARFKLAGHLNERAASDGLPPMPLWTGDPHAFFAGWLEQSSHFTHLGSFWERRRDPRILLLHYNDLKADLAGEMRRVAAFLGVEVPDHAWPEVVARCTFERMREGEDRMGRVDMIFKGGLKSFVFKGTNGRWRDVLTADELAAYDRRVAAVFTPECAAWVEQGRRALAR